MRTMSLDEARRYWSAHQGLTDQDVAPGAVPGGWTRAIGGRGPYLAMLARGCSPTSHIEEALRDVQMAVSPGVRGCIWLMETSDVTLATVVGNAKNAARLARDMEKCGVTDEELNTVETAVVQALGAGPASTRALRDRLPTGCVRSLGAVGKKIGQSSTLPPALRRLEVRGVIRRVPEAFSLVYERYVWTLAPEGWLREEEVPEDPVACLAQLADRYLRWAAPARLADFIAWAACGKRDAARAFEHIGAVACTVAGEPGWFAHADQLAEPTPEPTHAIRLLPTLDNLLTLRGDVRGLLDEAHYDRPMPALRGGDQPASATRWPLVRAIVCDGAWLGVWGWDAAASEMVLAPFSPLGAEDTRRLEEAAHQVHTVITTAWDGVAKTLSIDGEKRQTQRMAWLRQQREAWR
ncbi:MAG: DNA glycosylase AlkZ-like family protein [Myxococcota bacterium]